VLMLKNMLYMKHFFLNEDYSVLGHVTVQIGRLLRTFQRNRLLAYSFLKMEVTEITKALGPSTRHIQKIVIIVSNAIRHCFSGILKKKITSVMMMMIVVVVMLTVCFQYLRKFYRLLYLQHVTSVVECIFEKLLPYV
jgi:hypothetical protein